MSNVIDIDSRRPHGVGYAVCRECPYWSVCVVDVRADLTKLECGGCGKMTAEMQPNPPGKVIPFPATTPSRA